MYEVKEIADLGQCLDAYTEAYRLRYKIDPIVSSNGSDQTILRDFVKQLGVEKTLALVKMYLSLPDDSWFPRTSHSIAGFKKNIHVVVAALGKRNGAVVPMNGLLVAFKYACEKCKEYFDCTYRADKLSDYLFCPKCTDVAFIGGSDG